MSMPEKRRIPLRKSPRPLVPPLALLESPGRLNRQHAEQVAGARSRAEGFYRDEPVPPSDESDPLFPILWWCAFSGVAGFVIGLWATS